MKALSVTRRVVKALAHASVISHRVCSASAAAGVPVNSGLKHCCGLVVGPLFCLESDQGSIPSIVNVLFSEYLKFGAYIGKQRWLLTELMTRN